MLITFNSNETSLSVVEDAFKDSEVKDDICDVDTVSSLKDDTSETQLSGGREDSLKWLKQELNRQVGQSFFWTFFILWFTKRLH